MRRVGRTIPTRPYTTTAAINAVTGDAPIAEAPAAPAVEGDVVVFAAASLTAAFTEIGEAFMAEHPDANVVFNFAGVVGPGDADQRGRAGRRVRVGRPGNMTKLTDAGQNAREPGGVRDEHR